MAILNRMNNLPQEGDVLEKVEHTKGERDCLNGDRQYGILRLYFKSGTVICASTYEECRAVNKEAEK